MKAQAGNRSERQFEVGDMVFLKLQPYIQTSVAPRSNQKLAFKFFDPFKILSKVGQVAYKLDPPVSDSGPRGCVHQGVRIGLGDRTCAVPCLCCILPACGVELVDIEGNNSSCT
jgi:hypothetical protein